MSFAKPETKKEDNFDAVQKLMCSVPNCPNRWSVHSDGEKPKCSKHQWEKTSKPPAVKSWHDVGEVF